MEDFGDINSHEQRIDPIVLAYNKIPDEYIRAWGSKSEEFLLDKMQSLDNSISRTPTNTDGYRSLVELAGHLKAYYDYRIMMNDGFDRKDIIA